MAGAEEKSSSGPHHHVVLLGKTGNGKSATGNTILGRKAFISKRSFKTVTQEVKCESITRDGVNLKVYDTPGFFDPENELTPEEMCERYPGLPELDTPEPLVILLVLKTDRFTTEEKHTVEIIEDYLPDWLIKNTWIIFTGGDDLERAEQSIEDLIEESEDLKKVVQKFGNRYFVFNNVTGHPKHDQVQRLIEAIRNVQPQRPPETEAFLQRKSSAEQDKGTSTRRLLLLGKAGSGKSATGNTILRKKLFKSEHSFNSVTKHCDIHTSAVFGREVSVVDTPGFSDPTSNPEDLAQEMAKSVALSSPGPHAFLFVLSLTERIRREDEHDITRIERIYGKAAAKYTIPIFTHSDQLEGKSVEELIRENETLSRLVQLCGGRYHIMNNKDLRNREQVKDLLQKIDSMIEQNGGGHYCNQMFEETFRFRREEEQRLREEDQRRNGHTGEPTKESWIKTVVEFVYTTFCNLIAEAQRLYSFIKRIVKLKVNVTCMRGHGSDVSFALQMHNDQKQKPELKLKKLN